jgi:hypothetical protein
MAAITEEQECPSCHLRLAATSVPAYRPFSCKKCNLVIDPIPYYQRFGNIGCAGIAIIWLPVWIGLNLKWYLAVSGLAAAIYLSTVIIRLVARLWPQAPRLRAHELYTEPENLGQLAELLCRIADASAWNSDLESSLQDSKRRQTLDDWLENAAIDLAEICKDVLQGVPPRKKVDIEPALGPDALRAELRATAATLRNAGLPAGTTPAEEDS